MGLRITAGLLLMLASPLASAECNSITVSRAVLASAIDAREPAATVSTVTADTETLFAFTELMAAQGRTIYHRWYYDGELVAEVPLTARGDRWRTWSSKNLGLRRDNNWSVRIVDEQDCELARLSLGQPAPARLADPILALLADGDIASAKVKLAETMDAHPEHDTALTWQLQPAIALAQAAEQIESDRLYIAAARLDAIDTATADQARTKARLQQQLEQRRQALDRDTALSLSALERVFENGLTPCPLADAQARDQLATLAQGALSVMSSAADGALWHMQVLDQRTGSAHALNIACDATTDDPS